MPPSLSVVMPYYKNADTLPECLRSFSEQSHPPDEILVVDDGDSPTAAAIVEAHRGPVPVRLFHSKRAGQSGATNVGIRAARSELQLLTCADIIAHPDLVATHIKGHSQFDYPVGVMGNLPYHPDVKMTFFMRWINMPARQFAFALITDPDRVPPRFCYAPNLSVASKLLRQIDGFDEQFVYGYQDTDMGLRLDAQGLRFVYREQAIGYHLHATTVRRYYQRQVAVGVATLKMLRKWPDERSLDRIAKTILRYQAYVPKRAALIDDMERLEERMSRLLGLQRRVPEKLVQLFDFAMIVGSVEGMLQEPEALKSLMGERLVVAPSAPAPRSQNDLR
jgi:glycosyltransferase involved in cell wall biosynthesis